MGARGRGTTECVDRRADRGRFWMSGIEQGPSPEEIRKFGEQVRFGKTSKDYATHRAGFPPEFFSLLVERGWLRPGMSALDVWAGTGTVARGLYSAGCTVTATDPSEEMLAQARELSEGIDYQIGSAEALAFADESFDLVTAGQCWHWFDRSRAAAEAMRVLRPSGRVVIAHFDWLPLDGNMVDATEQLILKYNPAWSANGGNGVYPAWLGDLGNAGFSQIETVSFDIAQPYSHAAWRGRIRASAGVAASLDEDEVAKFDAELAEVLRDRFPQDPMAVPHRVWIATAVKT